ncbi:hypothetical protein M514_27551 [Trichuris suis]|uniref:Uncharacterized protein n=1 Tax=Trichuris suis TaxID=68888 RepID=A0A085MSR9_9BILA|nr:hypothetical protein M514_27551 [Trichuris suis]
MAKGCYGKVLHCEVVYVKVVHGKLIQGKVVHVEVWQWQSDACRSVTRQSVWSAQDESPSSYTYSNDPYSLARAYGIRDDQMDMNERGARHFELQG